MASGCRHLIAVRHQSMEPIPSCAIMESLTPDLQGCTVTELVVDQTDLFRTSRLMDPLEAARRQDNIEQRLAALLHMYPDARVVYYGIAHIPLLFLAGHRLSNRRRMTLFEYNRRDSLWNQLHLGREVPPLQVTGMPGQVVEQRGPVVVRVSISFRVTSDVVAAVIPDPIGVLDLSLERPRIDVITSEAHVRAYGELFRHTMDAIHAHFPCATGVHLFYSGPPSLAFCCGQQVSKTVHPQIVVYNYVARDTPAYSWGIDLTRGTDEVDFLIRPGQG